MTKALENQTGREGRRSDGRLRTREGLQSLEKRLFDVYILVVVCLQRDLDAAALVRGSHGFSVLTSDESPGYYVRSAPALHPINAQVAEW